MVIINCNCLNIMANCPFEEMSSFADNGWCSSVCSSTKCRCRPVSMETSSASWREKWLKWTDWSADCRARSSLLKLRYSYIHVHPATVKSSRQLRFIMDNFFSLPPPSAWKSGESAGWGGRARRADSERSQSPNQRLGGRAAEGQTGHGQAAQRVPGETEKRDDWKEKTGKCLTISSSPTGPDEPETGSGHWDRHLQEAAGGWRGQVRGGQKNRKCHYVCLRYNLPTNVGLFCLP